MYNMEYPAAYEMKRLDERWFEYNKTEKYASSPWRYERVAVLIIPWHSAKRNRLRNRFQVRMMEVYEDGTIGKTRTVDMDYTAEEPPTLNLLETKPLPMPSKAEPLPLRPRRKQFGGTQFDEGSDNYLRYQSMIDFQICSTMRMSAHMLTPMADHVFDAPPAEPRYRRN